MAFWIDLVIVAAVAFCAWRGFKNGLIRGVFGVAALIAALLIANIIATAYSQEFTGMLKPFIGGIVENAITDVIGEGLESDYDGLEHESVYFGAAYSAMRQIGLPEASAAYIAEHTALEEGTIISLADRISDRLSSTLAFVAVFGIAFMLLSIIAAIIGNLIGFVFSLPGLKHIDAIAGIVFGLAKGLIIVFALASIVRYFGLFAQTTLEGTTVLNYLINNNPIAAIIGI